MSDNSTPLATAKTFLAGIKARNTASVRSICQPGGTVCLIPEGEPRYLLVVDIFDRLIYKNAQAVMDEVSYDDVEHVDGDFATVWTPLRFFLDGKVLSSCSENEVRADDF